MIVGYSPDTGIGNVVDGKYLYIQDLLKLEATATGLGPGIFRPATPLRQPAWQRALSSHPDQAFSRYILQGITNGFHIGADRATYFRPNLSNMPSVQQQPQLVEAHLRTEAEAGRLLGPLPLHLARLVQTSPIGLIPKPRQPGKWRLIVDLSSPVGNSVNEAISPDVCHMQYASVLDAARIIRQMGAGSELAKLDLHNAYRMVPVHPDDHPLLGMRWGQDVFIDTALPFGLRSAPKIFAALADALAWILHARWVTIQLHYLDDFLLIGPPNSPAAALALQKTLETCQELGVPVATHKTEGPSCQLTFLGIHMDTVKMELSLLPDKLARISEMVREWSAKKWPQKNNCSPS